MTATLGTYLSAEAAARAAGAAVELATGLVIAWSLGDRRVTILGNEVPDVAYLADVVAAIGAGDTVALLKVGSSHLVIGKVATA